MAILAAAWIGAVAVLGGDSEVVVRDVQLNARPGANEHDEPTPVDKKDRRVENQEGGDAFTSSPSSKPASEVAECRESSNNNAAVDRPYGGMIPGRTKLSLSRETPLDWVRRCLEAVDEVEVISIRTSLLTPELIDLIAEVGNVRHITAGTVELSSGAGAALVGLNGVEAITLSGGAFEFMTSPLHTKADFHDNIKMYLSMRDLVRFETYSNFQVSDDVLGMIGQSRGITELILRNDDDLRRKNLITGEGLREIGRMRQLRSLTMHGFGPSLDHSGLSDLEDMLLGLPNLEELSLYGWPVEDHHLTRCLPVLQRLKFLDVRGTKLSAHFYSAIDSSWSLETLLASNSFGDVAAGAVSDLPNLTRLEIASSGITDEGLALLQRSVSLRSLNLNDVSGISPAGIRLVAGATSLKKLYLGDVPGLNSTFLFELARDSLLELLGLSEQEGVNHRLVRDIYSRTSVATLHVFKCKNLSKADIESLRNQFPTKSLEAVSKTLK
ncbi:MAG: hypothetical protein K8I27_16950 [Planctomycetes bacterium]|nr:hypothetical protein [Planctomycetota bacterium]